MNERVHINLYPSFLFQVLFLKLRYGSRTIKFTLLQWCLECSQSCATITTIIPEHFHHPQRNLVSIASFPSPWQVLLLSSFYSFFFFAKHFNQALNSFSQELQQVTFA